MLRTAVLLLVSALLGVGLGTTCADDEPDAPPIPHTAEAVATLVLEALQAEDLDTVRTLAQAHDPDPWIVADELCLQDERRAALAFAKAAPASSAGQLGAYVEARTPAAAEALHAEALILATRALAAGNGEEALEALADLEEAADTVLVLRLRILRGRGLRLLARIDESIAVLSAARTSAEALGWLRGAATAEGDIAASAFANGRWDAGLSALEARLVLERRIGHGAGVAETLLQLGHGHRTLGRFTGALRWYEALERYGRDAGEEDAVLEGLDGLGLTHFQQGDYANADRRLREALELAQKRKDRPHLARALTGLGHVHMLRGDHPAAVRHYEEALELERDLGNRGRIGGLLANLGSAYWSHGDLGTARQYLEEALEVAVALGNEGMHANTLVNLGLVREGLGDYAGALRCYAEAEPFYRARGNRHGLSIVLNNLGNIHERMGRYDRALELYEQALELSRAVGNRQGVARLLGNIGNLHESMREHEKALPYLEQALEQERALGNKPGMARALGNLGLLHMRQGNDAQALEHYQASLDLELELGNKAGTAITWNHIGSVYARLGKHDEALGAYAEALRLLEDAPDRAAEVGVLWNVALLHLERLEDPREALEWARRGVLLAGRIATGLGEAEGAAARDVYAGLYEVGLRAAARASDTEALSWFLEQGRSGSLRESLGSREELEQAVIPAPLLEALAAARQKERQALEAYRTARDSGKLKAIRTARDRWQEAQAEVARVGEHVQREAKHAAEVTLADPDSLAQIQARLHPKEALVLFGFTYEEAVALVVRREVARAVTLATTETIREATSALLDGDDAIVEEALPELRRLLVEPLGLGDDVRRVLLSPVGRLGYVPFSLLLPDKELAYVPSGTTYGLLLAERDKHGEKILALGDPDYRTIVDEEARARHRGSLRLGPLPATRKEAEAIGDVTILGEQATETGVRRALGKQERWRAVHFACHGLVDPQEPTLSSLALTAGTETDGFLTALEIFRMRIPADLVVLSACETGKGRIYQTEGIVGLTRAFMFAGAPRVICSLWKVDDAATQALMVRFYELWNDGHGAAEALRRAQAHVRSHEKWKHPDYWAAWVLWGLPD